MYIRWLEQKEYDRNLPRSPLSLLAASRMEKDEETSRTRRTRQKRRCLCRMTAGGILDLYRANQRNRYNVVHVARTQCYKI